MAEEFLTLMADLDKDAQARMDAWYQTLREAGFIGTQTPGLPYHISLATFRLEEERTAVEIMREAAAGYAPVPVYISHIGLFSPGRVLFGAPDINQKLEALHKACELRPDPKWPWTPHVTVLIDEPAAVFSALPLFAKAFVPFDAVITRLHLCAFWPKREIAAFELTGTR